MTILEQKIIEAKELGIKFNLIPINHGYYGEDRFDTLNVLQNITDHEFEELLDNIIEKNKEKSYLKILKSHNLI